MSIASYAELLTAIQAYEADTSTLVTGIQADMVTLAEQRIFRGSGEPGDKLYCPPLRCRAMEKTTLIPIGAGEDGGTSTGSANAHAVTLAAAPTLTRGLMITFTAGYTNTGATTLDANATGATTIRKGRSLAALEAGDILAGGEYTVYFDGTYYVLMPSDGACPVPSRLIGVKSARLQSPARILTQMPSSGMNLWLDGATADVPEYFAITNDAMRFDPLPSGNYKLALEHYAQPAALSSALNDIFLEAPGIYLFAALLELAIYLPNDDRADAYYNQYIAALKGYMRSDGEASKGSGPVRVRLGLAP